MTNSNEAKPAPNSNVIRDLDNIPLMLYCTHCCDESLCYPIKGIKGMYECDECSEPNYTHDD
jgi:hypothetical protein